MRKNWIINRVMPVMAAMAMLLPPLSALAQECPQHSTTGAAKASSPRTIEGSLIYHDGLRQWFELRLDQPQCGQSSVQLMTLENSGIAFETLRGCRVASTGPLYFSPTDYYSFDVYQTVERIEPVGACTRQPPFPDYSKLRPDKALRRYRVDMHFEYAPGDHQIMFHITSAGKELRPWQAYARLLLTGGLVLYGTCVEGFVVESVFGTPEAKPSHFDIPRTKEDRAAFNPESAAASGKRDLRLGYTCVRDR